MRIAILNDQDEVDNVIIAEPEFCEAQHPGRWVVVDAVWCDLGARWDGKTFNAPA